MRKQAKAGLPKERAAEVETAACNAVIRRGEGGFTNAELFDAYAEQYDAAVAQSVALVGGDVAHYAMRKVDVLKSAVAGKHGRILDFGCGVGALSFALCDGIPGCAVTGIDTSGESIARANRLGQLQSQGRARFVVGTEERLPPSVGTFDIAVAACVFHHIPVAARAQWVREIYDVLHTGGAFMMFEHNPRNPFTQRAVDACPFDDDAILLTPSEAAALLRSAGFVDVRVIHYLFLPPRMYRFKRLERWLRWLPIGGQFAVVGNHR